MKVTMTFDLSDPDDRMEHMRVMKSLDMASFIFELVCNTKKELQLKIESNKVSKYDALDLFYEKIHELLQEEDINIHKLLQ